MTRRWLVLVLGVLALVIADGVAWSIDDPRLSFDVPFRPLPAGDVPPWRVGPTRSVLASPDTTPCPVSDLRAELAGRPHPETADYRVTVTLREGAEACAFGGGRILATVVDDRGQQLGPRAVSSLLSAPTEPFLMEPGYQTLTWIDWPSECDRDLPALVWLRVSAGMVPGNLTVGPLTPPGCKQTPGPRALGLHAWNRAVLPPPEPHYPWDELTASLEVPAGGSSGDVLQFVVALHNSTAHDVSLSPCPVYGVYVGEGGTGFELRYRLNCADAPAVIGSGETVRFEMRMSTDPAAFGLDTAAIRPEPKQAGDGHRLGWFLESPQARAGVTLPVTVTED